MNNICSLLRGNLVLRVQIDLIFLTCKILQLLIHLLLVDIFWIRKDHILILSYHDCDRYMRRFYAWVRRLILFTNVIDILPIRYLIVEYRNFYLLQGSHFILSRSFESFIDLIFEQPNVSIIGWCTIESISSIIAIYMVLSHILSLYL
jgi:hypothetical protein